VAVSWQRTTALRPYMVAGYGDRLALSRARHGMACGWPGTCAALQSTRAGAPRLARFGRRVHANANSMRLG
jgi:hypothetical protein